MLINELAQWAVLAFMAVFLLGLTRQLGKFLIPNREQAALNFGPDIGKPLPAGLLSEEQRARVLDLIEERATGWAAVVVVSEDCPACEGLLERIRETGARDHAPVVAFSRKSGPAHEALLRDAADVAIVGSQRLVAANLTATPFTMVVDRSLKVLHKEIAADLDTAVDRWRSRNGQSPDAQGRRPFESLRIAHTGKEAE